MVAWGASPSPQLPTEANMRAAGLEFSRQTLREIIPASIGGDTVRVRLTNAYGRKSVEIGSVRLAVSAGGAGIVAGSDRALTFGGRGAITIPPNALVLSDPVSLAVPAGKDLAISLYLPGPAAAAGIHYDAQQTSYRAPGNQTAAPYLREPARIASWIYISGVDVLAPDSASTLVAFGDSITDGARSTPNANRRWPDLLAARLRARGGAEIGVLDAGIGGNRLLHDPFGQVEFGVNALARFDRDVLAQPGVRYVIVLEGINDLGHPGSGAPLSQSVTAADIIGALRQLIARAHEHGIKIFGATLTPFAGTTYPGYFTPAKDVEREEVNAWIRTAHAFDGVIDFDRAVRDPAHPDRLLPAYDGGDHLHPGDRGYQAMADTIDLSLLR